ncbi:hypothetical protein [Sedimentitalea sp. HM32M-2]|uniref:hypothetical protein n=1 Tax=Sedimentitalea sp. HM32M-2 TaxID=3351566 RepID=UPI0036D26690
MSGYASIPENAKRKLVIVEIAEWNGSHTELMAERPRELIDRLNEKNARGLANHAIAPLDQQSVGRLNRMEPLQNQKWRARYRFAMINR